MAQNSYMQEWSLLTARKSGRLIVSGGDTIAEFYETNVELPTLFVDETHKPFLECVLTKGTFFTLETLAENATIGADPHPQAGKTVANVCNGMTDVPQGLVVLDAMRSFANGEKFGLSFITEGYVEFPLIDALNEEIVVGDKIAIDAIGRPVKWTAATEIGGAGVDTHGAPVGVVKAVEIIGTDEFDTGMLEYMTLPYEEFMNALLRRPLELTDPATSISATPLFGYRGNLDVADVVGAMRVQLYKL